MAFERHLPVCHRKIATTTSAMPADNRPRLDDHQGIPTDRGWQNESRFGDFLRSTLSWWCSIRIWAQPVKQGLVMGPIKTATSVYWNFVVSGATETYRQSLCAGSAFIT